MNIPLNDIGSIFHGEYKTVGKYVREGMNRGALGGFGCTALAVAMTVADGNSDDAFFVALCGGIFYGGAGAIAGAAYGFIKSQVAAGNAEDEIAWPMPLLPAFEKEMTGSKVADVQNLGKGRWGGANTAAAFLKQFVQERDGEQIPWAHMDIAGTAWGPKEPEYQPKVGATGVAVRLIYHLLEN